MKSTKRYTNQTFTRRVDHEGGLHRGAEKMPEPTACSKCNALYHNGRWTAGKRGIGYPGANWTVCPACKQIESGVVGGYVSISGDFAAAHWDEIKNLIENEAAGAEEDNPLSRIMRVYNSKSIETVETTTEHLAQRIGHALKKAYDGEVSYDFSHENKVARVNWHRD